MAGGQERILRRRIRSVQSTKKITRAMELIAASRIAAAVRDPFLDGRIDMVQVIYTRFITVGSQEVVVRPLMPLEREIVRDEDERAREAETPRAAYEFEPGPGEILERLLPRYVEARSFAARRNPAAAEHAA